MKATARTLAERPVNRKPSMSSLYNTKEKRAAQQLIWEAVSPYAKHGDSVIMAESNREEVDIALSHGVRLRDFLFVEENSQKMSNFTRRFTGAERKAMPKKRRLSGYLSDVSWRWESDIAITSGHLDFMGNLEGSGPRTVRYELASFLRCPAFVGGALGITIQPSREILCRSEIKAAKNQQTAARLLKDTHQKRVQLLSSIIFQSLSDRAGKWNVSAIRTGIYTNTETKSGMLWTVFAIERERLK